MRSAQKVNVFRNTLSRTYRFARHGVYRLMETVRPKKYSQGAWQTLLAPEAFQEGYDEMGWSGPSGSWRQRSVERLAERIREIHAKEGHPVSLLDVACFSGDYFGRLMEQPGFPEMVRYTGVDVTPRYVEHASRRWQNWPQAKFVVSSAYDLTFPDRHFDIVFNSGMLIHVDDVDRCLSEFVRVARHYVLVETTIDPEQRTDFFERNPAGTFIDRIYREQYIATRLASRARIVQATSVIYQEKPTLKTYQSVLFEAAVGSVA